MVSEVEVALLMLLALGCALASVLGCGCDCGYKSVIDVVAACLHLCLSCDCLMALPANPSMGMRVRLSNLLL